MTDWLEVCRAAAGDLRRVLGEMPDRAERERVIGIGEGGDETTAVDAAAESAVVARLDATGEDFTLVSEELGIRPARNGGATHLVVDPIDGSINAKRGIPFFSLSIAVASGPTLGDVDLAFVHDLGTGEEWTARRGEGAFLDGRRLERVRPAERIDLLSLEATRTDLVAEHAPALVPIARRVRVMGSLALSLCHLAAGRVDAVCCLRPIRSVDVAAALLLVHEVGLAADFVEGGTLAEGPLDLQGRSRIAAAATPELVEQLAAALR